MIFNENGYIVEHVTIHNRKIIFSSSFITESVESSPVLKELDKIKDILKECDDKKLKKITNKAKDQYLSERVYTICTALHILAIPTAILAVPIALITEKIIPIILGLFGISIIFKLLSKIPAYRNKKSIESITNSLNQIINAFKQLSDNDRLSNDIRKTAQEKMSKVILVRDEIAKKKNLNVFEILNSSIDKYNYENTDLKIKGKSVAVNSYDHYELNIEEYKKVAKIVESKIDKVITQVYDNFNKSNINIKSKKYLCLYDNVENYAFVIKCNNIQEYETKFYIEYDFEEYSELIPCYIYINLNTNLVELKMGNIGERHSANSDKLIQL